MRRKFLSVVLCVCMMLTMAPFAFAEGNDGATTEIGVEGGSSNTSSGGSGGTTLQDQINAIGSTGTITLNRTYTEDVTIPASKNITLNLNGQTLQNVTTNTITVENGATLTVTGTGTVDNITHGKAALYNKGTVVLEGGTFERSAEAGIDATHNGGNSYYTVLNHGSMTVKSNVTVNNKGHYSSLFENGYFDYTKTQDGIEAPFLIIDGGKFDGGLNTIKNDDNATLTINDGTFINYTQAALQNHHIATINGGTFTATDANAVLNCGVCSEVNSGHDNHAITINNGTFTGAINRTVGTISISGGTYSVDVSDFCAEGYYSVKDREKYTVKPLNEVAVAKIGDNLYTSLSAAISAASDGQTVTLLKNTTESVVIPANRTVTFDLNGNKLTAPTDKRYDAIVNYGTLTINDSKKTGEIISNKNSGIGIGANSNTTIVYAKITGQEGAIGGYKNTVDATLTINDGIFNGIDNAVVIFNGSKREGNANTIIINGGTFNGGIQSEGYIACGIYAPWKDNIIVKGGTFNITGGAGIVARAGNVTVTDGEFNTTGNTTGKVGDSRVVVPCSALVFDSGANYPALTGSSKLTINGGKFKSDVNNIAVVIPDAGDTNTRVEVTKGYFTSDPTPYCGKDADGKQLVGIPSTDSNYPFTVGTLAAANVDVAPANPQVKVDNTIPDNVKETATAAANAAADTSATGLDAIGGKEATNVTSSNVDAAKEQLSKTPDVTINSGDSVTLYVQPYLDITVTGAKVNKHQKATELSLSITPMVKKVASTAKNANDIALTNETGKTKNATVISDTEVKNVNTPVTIKLALPNGFAQDKAKLSIKHTKANGSIEYYTGIVSTEGEGTDAKTYVTFTTNGFSPFVISAAAAFIGDTAYPTFQEAVENVKNDETITLAQNVATDTVVTVARTVKFSIDTSSSSFVFGKDKNIVAGSNTTVNVTGTESSYTYNFTYTRPSSSSPGSSGGSISAPTTYAVNVNAATNGAVAADKKTASKGTTVTVTASPSKGYVVDAVKVVDKDGKDVAVTGKDGKYVFTMPGSAVTVTGTFKAETPAPVALPFTDVKSGNWFYDAVKYAYEQGLMTGTSATTFAPNGTMNRAMIVTVLYRLEKSPAVTGASKFTDVPAGQWYSDAVAWAAANKIVNGYDETTFGPMNAVTREQMAAILFRYEQVKGLENVTLEENLNRFPDQNKISAYAIPALQWAVGQKIINGNADGTLDPTGTATRAQVAQIFTNLLNK